MSIRVDCPQCGRAYALKDELAGKRFRCKDCQQVVAIPAAADDFAELADDDPFGDADEAPPPRAKPVGKKKSKKKKSRKRGSAAAKTALTVAAIVLGAGVVLGGLGTGGYYAWQAVKDHLPKPTPDVWQKFTPNRTEVSVMMPGKPEEYVNLGSYQQSIHRVKYQEQTFTVKFTPIQSNTPDLPDEERYEMRREQLAKSPDKWRNLRITKVDSRVGLAYESNTDDWSYHQLEFRQGNRLFYCVYGYKEKEDEELRKRFFSSIKIGGPANNATVATWSDFTTPDGVVTVSLPAKTVTVPKGPYPNSQAYGTYKDGRMFSIVLDPLRPEQRNLSQEQLLAISQPNLKRIANPGTYRQHTISGYIAQSLEDDESNKAASVLFAVDGILYTVMYQAKHSFIDEDKNRFLQSVRINK